MNNAYDRALRRTARQVAVEMGLEDVVREGVYVMLGGPTYETVAELNLLRILGVDAVGMSTVPEVRCGVSGLGVKGGRRWWVRFKGRVMEWVKGDG